MRQWRDTSILWKMNTPTCMNSRRRKNCTGLWRNSPYATYNHVRPHSYNRYCMPYQARIAVWGKVSDRMSFIYNPQWQRPGVLPAAETGSGRNRSVLCASIYGIRHTVGERGSNEWHNGLIRKFLPKGRQIEEYSTEDIDWIEDWMNGLPRKGYGYHIQKE